MSHHQDAAKAFLKMAGAGNVQEAYDRYIAPSFTYHKSILQRGSAVVVDCNAGGFQNQPEQINRYQTCL